MGVPSKFCGRFETSEWALCHESARHLANIFVPVFHEDEVEDGVEAGHHEVRHAQVHQEVVGHISHPSMS